MTQSPLHLFEGFGVEIEYMIVDDFTLDILPIADSVLRQAAGDDEYEMEVERGDIAWSNELVLHVIELKTNGPSRSLEPLAARFQHSVRDINEILAARGARLMPAAMHPWMDPMNETRLWPHEDRQIYDTFDRIFGCRGHGWSNLQSTHINLPFAGDDEFGRLHAAIRAVLPLVPALAASSPLADGRPSGFLDYRLDTYRRNCSRVPSVTGAVIPEAVFSQRDYERVILERMYADIAPHDPEGVLRHVWLNARGAIARFDRGTIEIRLVDCQECPRADLAVVEAVVRTVEALVGERWLPLPRLQELPIEGLRAVLDGTTRDGERARIDDAGFLRAFGLAPPLEAGRVWAHLVGELFDASKDGASLEPLGLILDQGPLARRLLAALGIDDGAPHDSGPDRAGLQVLYEKLCACLASGSLFRAPS